MDIRQHLLDRGVDFSKCRVVVDEDNQTATFFIFTLSGKLVGYQQYKPNAPKKHEKDLAPKEMKYFSYVTKSEPHLADSVAVFGTESFDWLQNEIFIVEGIFDAVKFHALGLNCFAVLGNDPKKIRSFFRSHGKKIIGVLDGDAAGSSLAKFCDEVFVCPPGKDPGDMTHEEIRVLINK